MRDGTREENNDMRLRTRNGRQRTIEKNEEQGIKNGIGNEGWMESIMRW